MPDWPELPYPNAIPLKDRYNKRFQERHKPLPKWCQSAGFESLRTATARQRIEGLEALADDICYRLQFSIKDRKKEPRSSYRGRTLTSPFVTPLTSMAHFFELPVPRLEALVREGSGFSASQWWDIFRGEDKDIGIRTRLHSEIQSLVPKCVFKTQPVLDDLIREMRRQRRLIGLTSPGRAWKWGYRYPARLHLACFFATGLTFQELEMKMLEGVLRTWRYDPTRCTLFRIRQGAPPRHARAPQPRQQRRVTPTATSEQAPLPDEGDTAYAQCDVAAQTTAAVPSSPVQEHAAHDGRPPAQPVPPQPEPGNAAPDLSATPAPRIASMSSTPSIQSIQSTMSTAPCEPTAPSASTMSTPSTASTPSTPSAVHDACTAPNAPPHQPTPLQPKPGNGHRAPQDAPTDAIHRSKAAREAPHSIAREAPHSKAPEAPHSKAPEAPHSKQEEPALACAASEGFD